MRPLSGRSLVPIRSLISWKPNLAQTVKSSNSKPFPFSAATVARALKGKVTGADQVRAPGPDHSPSDDSLVVTIDPTAPDGFLVHSFAGDDPIRCKDYVRERCGLSYKHSNGGRTPVEHIYRDENGQPYIKVTRKYL